jgi:stage V sporulation protein R
MMDAYASVGMPVNYRHWSYGKEFIATEKNYKRGHMGLAYEIVINSQPLHQLPDGGEHDGDAGAGDRARRLRPQQLLQGQLPVPHVDRRGVDHRLPGLRQELRRRARRSTAWTRSRPSSTAATRWPTTASTATAGRAQDAGAGTGRAQGPRGLRAAAGQRPLAHAAAQAPRRKATRTESKRFPDEPQENLLYFIEKNAPLLEPWQREIVRIVRKVAQYFYPQRQTQVMNEGWATFWHHKLLNTMYDDGF